MHEASEIVLIAGPTASGKSALALELARHIGGVIVNADAMQVYAGLEIITAQPDAAARQAVPHRLYGHVPPQRAYSVGRFLEDARRVLEEIEATGRPAIFVGGTGLYFKAMLEGLSEIPAADPKVRTYWREQAARGTANLHGELMLRDPEGAAAIRSTDTQRLIRALEVFDSTGRPISFWRGRGKKPLLASRRLRQILLMPERVLLHEAINRRFDLMLEQGAISEAARIAELHLPADLPAMKAIGLPQLLRFCAGELTLAEAAEQARAATRQYAKRQTTWFRHQLPGEWEIRN